MCGCDREPLCQWCKKVVHGCRETVVPNGGKRYHVKCWMALRQMADRVGGYL